MGARRFELRTSPLSGVRSSQLSYAPFPSGQAHSNRGSPSVNNLDGNFSKVLWKGLEASRGEDLGRFFFGRLFNRTS